MPCRRICSEVNLYERTNMDFSYSWEIKCDANSLRCGKASSSLEINTANRRMHFAQNTNNSLRIRKISDGSSQAASFPRTHSSAKQEWKSGTVKESRGPLDYGLQSKEGALLNGRVSPALFLRSPIILLYSLSCSLQLPVKTAADSCERLGELQPVWTLTGQWSYSG